MRLVKIALLSASALLFLGCSSSPKDAVNGMFEALTDGDIKGLNAYATQGTVRLLTLGATMKCKKNIGNYSDEEEYISDCMQEVFGKASIDDVEVIKETEERASVIVTENVNGKKTKENMQLVKVDGNWKVNIGK